MRIAVLLGERFYLKNAIYSSPTYNLEFLKSVFNGWDIDVFALDGQKSEKSENSSVNEEDFEAMPYYSDNKDFIVRSIRDPSFLRRYRELAERVSHYDAVWVRTPSFGPLYVAKKLASQRERKAVIYNHICADARNSWFNPKYSGLKVIPAYLLSFATHFNIDRLSSKHRVVTLATGDKIYSEYKDSSWQIEMIIDSNVNTSYLKSDPLTPFEKKKVFGFLGRVTEDKGAFDLLDAFSRCPEDTQLIVAGDGPVLPQIKEMAIQKGLLERVQFLGHITQGEVEGFFEKIDILVVPSQNGYEGFPRVILESWANNTPVICTPTGGITSFIQKGENGLICSGFSAASIYKAMVEASALTTFDISQSTWALSQKSHWVNHTQEIICNHHAR